MSNRTFITPLIAFITIALLTGCNNSYVSTNLDEENFSHYFSASNVKIYQHENEIKTHYQYLGVIEGQDCQIKPHHAAPDEVNARTQARQQAFKQEANGVVFTGCVLLTPQQLSQLNQSNEAQQCHAIVICYAKAFTINHPINKE